MSDVIDSVSHHDEASEAEAKGPALVFIGVNAAGFEDGRVGHAAAHEFDPTGFFAHTASFFIAKNAGHVELKSGFHKRKIARAKTNFHFFVKKSRKEVGHDAFEVCNGNVFVNEESFDLVKGVLMRSISGFVAEYAARHNDSKWGAVFLHGADLIGRGVGAKD